MDAAAQQTLEWELTRLNYSFFRHLDRREYEAAAELIAEDGVIHFSAAVTRGRDELLAYVRQWPDLTVRHVVTNLLYSDITDRSATGEGLLSVFVGPPRQGDAAPPKHASEPHLAEVRDRYVKTDGGWRIAERTFHNLLLPAVG